MAFPKKHPDAVVTAALAAFQGNLSAAARSLGQQPKTLWQRVQRNPALWPVGVARLPQGWVPRKGRTRPAWVPCRCCEEFVCTIHGGHVSECACPPIEEWATDPYSS